MTGTDTTIDPGRRRALAAIAGTAAVGGLARTGTRTAVAQPVDLTDWFDGVENFDGVADRTGQEEVRVEVGVDANGGPYGFGPAAVRVDSGTTVVWEWTGEGSHDVAAEDDDYASDLVGDAGHTFERTFEEEGASRYVCSPHRTMGMRGAVVVGDVEVTVSGGQSGDDGSGDDEANGGDSTGDGSSAAASVDPDYEGWFDDVDSFEGTIDRTGHDEVRIDVGADGGLAFGPAAIHVDPGTTVVWEWTGEGGQHNVVAREGPDYEGDLQSEAGATYAVAFDGVGISKYACAPHEAAGMKGAVVVGDPAATAGGGPITLEHGLWGLAGAIVAAPFVASELLRRRRDDESGGPGGSPARRVD